MNQLKQYGPRDLASSLAGDRFFAGVDERRSPVQLEEGMLAKAVNTRLRKGKAETRKGIIVCPWMKGNGYTPWDEVYGAIVFSDPNQPAEWFVIAADGGVWMTRPNTQARPVPLPANTSLNADSFAMFVQCFNALILLRGPNHDPLVCTNLDLGFTAVPAHTVSGKRDMPRSSFGFYHLNRLWLVEGKDLLAVSDPLDYANFATVENVFRINEGSVDRLVSVRPIARGTLICLKSQSILAMTGVTVDLSAPQLDEITDRYGCESPHGVARSGANLYWVSENGHIASLQLTAQNETQDTHERLSEPMEQTFGRVNPLHLHQAALEVWDGKLYCALPLDDARGTGTVGETAVEYNEDGGTRDFNGMITGAEYYWNGGVQVEGGPAPTLTLQNPDDTTTTYTGTTWFRFAGGGCFATANVFDFPGTSQGLIYPVNPRPCNNAVAVYDFANQAWCGVDEAPDVINVQQWLKGKYLGRTRLFALGRDGVLRLYEHGSEDETIDRSGTAAGVTARAVRTEWLTRGYTGESGDRAHGLGIALSIRTQASRYTVSVLTPAIGSETIVRTNEPLPGAPLVHGAEGWNEANPNDDQQAPGREDYAVHLVPDGVNLGTGVNVDAMQAGIERAPVESRGQYLQARVVCDKGRMELMAAGLETQEDGRETGYVS